MTAPGCPRTEVGSCDITTEEGRKTFVERDLLNRTCKPCVQTVVSLVEGMIDSMPEQGSEDITTSAVRRTVPKANA